MQEFLRRCSKHSTTFKEPEGSLPRPQKPTTGSYSEPVQNGTQSHFLFDFINIVPVYVF